MHHGPLRSAPSSPAEGDRPRTGVRERSWDCASPAPIRTVSKLGAEAMGGLERDAVGAFQVMADPEGNEFCFVSGIA
ncbi:hypothetical protein ITP53_07780 [Nonomuraea sp. K274]|uniref:Glyoxalase-like domain-containing protein n=1 Tax=Nonomuraea cypriaca TaxID=1187855 RepID=A0A931A5R4_9ACTN|nr:hypothetical protein [Nonomuraea cypriaca]